MLAFGEKYCSLHYAAFALLVIGGLNWLLVGIGGYTDMNLNVVNLLLGTWPMVEWAVYIVVGIATIVTLFQSSCTMCRHSTVVIKK